MRRTATSSEILRETGQLFYVLRFSKSFTAIVLCCFKKYFNSIFYGNFMKVKLKNMLCYENNNRWKYCKIQK